MAEQKPRATARFGRQRQPPCRQPWQRAAFRHTGHAAAQGHFQRPQAFRVIRRQGEQAAPRVQPQPGQTRRVGRRCFARPKNGNALRQPGKQSDDEGDMRCGAFRGAAFMHGAAKQAVDAEGLP